MANTTFGCVDGFAIFHYISILLHFLATTRGRGGLNGRGATYHPNCAQGRNIGAIWLGRNFLFWRTNFITQIIVIGVTNAALEKEWRTSKRHQRVTTVRRNSASTTPSWPEKVIVAREVHEGWGQGRSESSPHWMRPQIQGDLGYGGGHQGTDAVGS